MNENESDDFHRPGAYIIASFLLATATLRHLNQINVLSDEQCQAVYDDACGQAIKLGQAHPYLGVTDQTLQLLQEASELHEVSLRVLRGQ